MYILLNPTQVRQGDGEVLKQHEGDSGTCVEITHDQTHAEKYVVFERGHSNTFHIIQPKS